MFFKKFGKILKILKKKMSTNKFDIFIKGEEVNLVALNKELISTTSWYKWFNDEDNTKTMMQHYYPNNIDEQIKYYDNEIVGKKDKIQLGIMSKINNELIGMICLFNINFIDRRAELSLIIGEKKYKEMKYFIESNNLIFKHAVNTLGLRKISGSSLSEGVLKLYERIFNFKYEGIFQEHVFKDGDYRDIYLFSKIFKKT